MDSKGRPTAADIPDREMLIEISQGHGFRCFPTTIPIKVLRAKAAKLAKRGLIEVTADNYPRWITPRGREFLAKPPAVKKPLPAAVSQALSGTAGEMPAGLP